MTIIAPPSAQASMPKGRSPPVADRTFSALKKTPLPITMPTTIAMAVMSPYFSFSCLSMTSLLFFCYTGFVRTKYYCK